MGNELSTIHTFATESDPFLSSEICTQPDKKYTHLEHQVPAHFYKYPADILFQQRLDSKRQVDTKSETHDIQTDGQEVDSLRFLNYENINDPRFIIIRKTINNLFAEKNELFERVKELEQKNEILIGKKNVEEIKLSGRIKELELQNVNLRNELYSVKSNNDFVNDKVIQLNYEILDKNTYIQKVNDAQQELIDENERLHLAIVNNTKYIETQTEEFEQQILTLNEEIEELNGLVKRQRKNITETQTASKSKNDKIKMLSTEKNLLTEQVRRLEEKNAAMSHEKAKLEDKNRQLNEIVADVVAEPSPKTKAELVCNICLDDCLENCWIFAPCGHYACGNCKKQLRNCQTCRVKITSKIKLFI